MKINWIKKLTSRKFWVTVSTFVSMLIVALGYAESTATQVAALIVAGGAWSPTSSERATLTQQVCRHKMRRLQRRRTRTKKRINPVDFDGVGELHTRRGKDATSKA